MNDSRALKIVTLSALFATISACGGGGSSTPTSTPTMTPAPAPAPAPAPPAPAPAPSPVATLPAGSTPQTGATDCANLLSKSIVTPVAVGADMQATRDVLTAVDPAHGLAEFARLDPTFMYWVRAAGAHVDQVSVGTAIHETNHRIDFTLEYTCNTDGVARLYADSAVHTTGLTIGSTAHFNIVDEVYPEALKISRADRYAVYITGAEGSTDDFDGALEEQNAYVGGGNFEARLLASSYAYLAVPSDANAGGAADTSLYVLAYLQAARLNHPATYALLQSQPQTIAFLQFEWTRFETMLTSMYPYSVVAGGNQVVPVDVLKAIYSPAFIGELDRLGITHKTASDWSATYLR